MASKQALGKGLASLLPGILPPPAMFASPINSNPEVNIENKDRHPGISVISVEEIVTNQYQPRRDFVDSSLEELAQSIRSNGIIQPLIVRKNINGGYQLIAGERRLRAAKIAGLKQVPIVIRRSTDREALELALIENIQRENLNCIDEALAYFQLLQDFSLTQEEVAGRVGKDRATVANYLRLLRLPEIVVEELKKQNISFGHGKALLGIEDSAVRLNIFKQVLENKLSVRETERLAEEQRAPQSAEKSNVPQAIEKSATQNRLIALSQDLAKVWGTKVEIKGNGSRGKFVIHYSNRQELERVLEMMQN